MIDNYNIIKHEVKTLLLEVFNVTLNAVYTYIKLSLIHSMGMILASRDGTHAFVHSSSHQFAFQKEQQSSSHKTLESFISFPG